MRNPNEKKIFNYEKLIEMTITNFIHISFEKMIISSKQNTLTDISPKTDRMAKKNVEHVTKTFTCSMLSTVEPIFCSLKCEKLLRTYQLLVCYLKTSPPT